MNDAVNEAVSVDTAALSRAAATLTDGQAHDTLAALPGGAAAESLIGAEWRSLVALGEVAAAARDTLTPLLADVDTLADDLRRAAADYAAADERAATRIARAASW